MVASGQHERIEKRLLLVHEVLSLRESDSRRVEVMRRLARAAGFSLRTLYRDVRRFQKYGDLGLARKRPSNAGEPRVVVSRIFDREIADANLLNELSVFLDGRLKSMWKSSLSSGGAKKIGVLASRELEKECHARGLAVSAAALRIPLHRVNRFRKYGVVHLRATDRAAFNEGVPRITRDYTNLQPMEIVVADVKHLDVVVCRPDRSLAYPKMVAFEDGATGRVFARTFLLPQGEQVRCEHVTETFVAMVSDSGWGFPRHLLLDNGPEFKAFRHLRHVFSILNRRGVAGLVYTRPYSPQSKRIEGWFGRFDEWGVSMIPGYVGPDRLNKKVETVGRPTKPFPGDFTVFQATIAALIVEYAHWEVGGAKDRRSPESKFAAFVRGGWRPQPVDPTELDAAFRVIKRGQVNRGKIKISGRHYYHPSLDQILHRTPVEVARPWRRDDAPFYRALGDADWIPLEPERAFHPLDPAGAQEAARRRANYSRAVTKLAREAPTIDPLALVIGSGRQSAAVPAGQQPHVDLGTETLTLARAIAGGGPPRGGLGDGLQRLRQSERVERLLRLDGPLTGRRNA